jgi:hypothetical protein
MPNYTMFNATPVIIHRFCINGENMGNRYMKYPKPQSQYPPQCTADGVVVHGRCGFYELARLDAMITIS